MKKAIIFDMDGVIIDSERYWQTEEFFFIKQLLPDWSEADQQKIIGLHLPDIYEVLLRDYGVQISKVDFIQKIESIAQIIYENHINLMPDFVDTIGSLKGSFYLALASSAKRDWINITLRRFNLKEYFDYTISAEELNSPGKPAPDIYLHVAQHFNLSADNCMVIEDSFNGIKAAKSADMFCIGFRSDLNQQTDLSQADIIIDGFKEFDIKKTPLI